MLIEVSRPYVDMSAGDLSLTLGAAPAAAIETLRVCAGGYAIELRLLGCSHQALVEDGEHGLSETVACVPGVRGSLPEERIDGRYSFRARVERHCPAVYAARAAGVLASVTGDPRALVGVFAPSPGAAQGPCRPATAFTALAASPSASGNGIAWTTWHGYPQSGELVVTSSCLEGAA